MEDKALDFSSAKVVMDYQKNSFKTTLVVNCKYHVVPAEVEDFDLYKSFERLCGEGRYAAQDDPRKDPQPSGASAP